jgi:hypothetical protein
MIIFALGTKSTNFEMYSKTTKNLELQGRFVSIDISFPYKITNHFTIKIESTITQGCV